MPACADAIGSQSIQLSRSTAASLRSARGAWRAQGAGPVPGLGYPSEDGRGGGHRTEAAGGLG